MNIIKEYRIRMGLTQNALAEVSGVSRPVIARIESGKALNECKVDTLLKLSKTLGCKTVDELLGAKDAS